MMPRVVIPALLLLVASGLTRTGAGEGADKKALAELASRTLAARTVRLPEAERDVDAALAEIVKQTGNRVVDRRAAGSRRVKIGFESVPFWPALDALAAKLEARISPYAEEGAAALVDGPNRVGEISYAGPCRLEANRIDVQLDVATRRRTCVVNVDVAWEPRFEPLYLTVERVAVRYTPDAQGHTLQAEEKSRVAQPVARRGAQTLEIRLPAPDRSAAGIAHLEGTLRFVGPERMLDFTFPRLAPVAEGTAPLTSSQDGVQVAVTKVSLGKRSWTLDILIRNPEGTPAFETHQSWLDNNRVHLERRVGGRRVVWEPGADDWQLLGDLTPRQAHLRYRFTNAEDRGAAADWDLVVRTPGRIVELRVPIQFKDLPLS